MRIRSGALCLLLALISQSAAFGGRGGGAAPEIQNNDKAKAGVVRFVTAAQRAYFRDHDRYATFPALIQSGQLEKTATQSSTFLRALQILNLKSPAQPVAGFAFGLAVTPDGRGYQVSLTRQVDNCRSGWFSDETGTLYEAKAMDCVDKLATSAPNGWSPPDIDDAVPTVNSSVACPLGLILEETAKRADELVENLQRFTADDRIEQIELGKDGKQHHSSKELAHYTAEILVNPSGTYRIQEYRSMSDGSVPPPISDTGTAAFALIFHPRQVEHFDIRCEGQTEVNGLPAWQLRFEESPDQLGSFHSMHVNGSVYFLRLKGRAWIAADGYQVLRLQTDLINPIPQIELHVEHLDIAYAPVEFRKLKLQLWLPKQASLYIGYHGHRYERVHSFSAFQLFNVETQQSVKEPAVPPEEQPQ
jgi:hypothetical protein